jgi:hypothetical protein
VNLTGLPHFALAGQIIQEHVIEFPSQVGFDGEPKDFLNVQNNGMVQGPWEMMFENPGG